MRSLTELRLNNWVYSLEIGGYVQIASIDSQFVTVKEHVIFDHVYADMIEPIPLTEEILLKCGFEKYGDFWYVLGDIKIEVTTRGYFRFSGYVRIYHLHQLQNLYFALNGEELKIEL